MGVSPEAVQKWAQRGLIPFDSTLGGHRRFSIDEVRSVRSGRPLLDHVAREITEQIARWQVQPVHASIYGSVARHEERPDSDIDVMLVRPPITTSEADHAWLQQLRELISSGEKFDRDVQPFVVGKDDLLAYATASPLFFAEVVVDGVVLRGTTLAHLLRPLLDGSSAKWLPVGPFQDGIPSGASTYLVDTGYVPDQLCSLDQLAGWSGGRVAEVARIETLAERVAARASLSLSIGAGGAVAAAARSYAAMLADEMERRGGLEVGRGLPLRPTAAAWGWTGAVPASPAEVRDAAGEWLSAGPDRQGR